MLLKRHEIEPKLNFNNVDVSNKVIFTILGKNNKT